MTDSYEVVRKKHPEAGHGFVALSVDPLKMAAYARDRGGKLVSLAVWDAERPRSARGCEGEPTPLLVRVEQALRKRLAGDILPICAVRPAHFLTHREAPPVPRGIPNGIVLW